MGRMLIRNLDDGIVAALKRRAAENRTSAEEEARRALAASIGDRAAVLAALDRACAMNGPQTGPSSTEMLRWDRDRDERALFERAG